MTSHAIFGILTDTSFTYFKGERNIRPDKAYRTLVNSYDSPASINVLLNSYDASHAPISNATRIDDMRYHLKQLFLTMPTTPDYGYVFNTHTSKWYVWEKATNGWIALTKLEQYL